MEKGLVNYSASVEVLNKLSGGVNDIDSICKEYGLYAKILNCDKNFLETGIYIFISPDPIADDVSCFRLMNRAIRNPNLFYPKCFSAKLTETNAVVVLDDAMEYCRNTEFLKKIYEEYETELPQCIRYSELVGLKNWVKGRDNSLFGERDKKSCRDGLKEFFKNENRKSSSFQKKRAFFRNEKYDETVGSLQRMTDFNNREEPLVRLSTLMLSSNETNKIRMTEGTYQKFYKYIKSCYPDIMFAVGEKMVEDPGLLDLAKKLPGDHPFLQKRPVTKTEFDEIVRKRFATEGFACMNDLNPVQFEFRDVYYKEVDAPQIIGVYLELFCAFAAHDPIQTLLSAGDINMTDLPADDFYYFVADAKKLGLKFHIDYMGTFANPSLTDLHVIYNTKNQPIMDHVINDMVKSNIVSHIVEKKDLKAEISLSQKISSIDESLNFKQKDFGKIQKSEECYDR